MIWLIFAAIIAATIVAIAWPLSRGGTATPRPAGNDAAVYKDQLAEIDRDRERGLLTDSDAEAARNEIARRLLRAKDETAATATAPSKSGPPLQQIALVAVFVVPLLAVALYRVLGAPWLPDQPFASRPQANLRDASFGELVAKVEAQLRDHPDDVRGWDVIAPVYLRLGRYEDAADAFRRAITLNGETETRLMGLADAMVAEKSGVVSDDARKLLEKVLALNREHPGARFLLALSKEQDGKIAEATKDYREILAAAPAEAPWRKIVSDRLAALTGEKRPHTKQSDEKGPDAEQIEASRTMTPEQRAQMINNMVSGLAERLKKDGRDLQGWLRLARAYKVLGKPAEAKEALLSARKAFAGEEKAISEIAEAEKSLGL